MKKGIIILGKQGTGKTTIAKDIVSFIDPKNILHIDGSEIESNSFIFNEAHPNTEVIVIDEIDEFEPAFFYEYIFQEIRINKRGQSLFTIEPTLIFIANKIKEDFVDLNSATFKRRFDIVDTSDVDLDYYMSLPSPRKEFFDKLRENQLKEFWDNHIPKQSESSNHIIK